MDIREMLLKSVKNMINDEKLQNKDDYKILYFNIMNKSESFFDFLKE